MDTIFLEVGSNIERRKFVPYRDYLGLFIRLFLSYSLVRGGVDGEMQSFFYKNIAFPEQGKYSYVCLILGCK